MLDESLGKRGVAAPAAPTARPIPDDVMKLALSSPDSVRRAREAINAGKLSVRPDQEAELAQAEKSLGIGTREIKPHIRSRLQTEGGITSSGQGEFTAPFEEGKTSLGTSLYRILKHPTTGKPITSRDEIRALPKKERDAMQSAITKALPPDAPKADDEDTWTDILAHPIFAEIAARIYPKETAEARKRLTSLTSRQQTRGLRQERIRGIFE